jgi:hypothetical protein
LAFGLALWNWASPNPLHFIIYFTLALIASMLKVRLPRITGTYSVSFLFTLVGIVEFTLPETLVASCAGALVQSLWKSKQRPTIIQILFNMANLCLSISLCYLVAHLGLAQGLGVFRPALLALIAALHLWCAVVAARKTFTAGLRAVVHVVLTVLFDRCGACWLAATVRPQSGP